MKAESILFLLSIHEGVELRDALPGSAYDDLVSAGLLDGTSITDKGYAYVRILGEVAMPVQMWVDPRSFAAGGAVAEFQSRHKPVRATQPAPLSRPVDVDVKILPADDTIEDVVPSGYISNPGEIPPGVDRASEISIVRANGKRKTLPAQSINWADRTSPDRVIGWRYALAAADARIHTPGLTVKAPDPSVT